MLKPQGCLSWSPAPPSCQSLTRVPGGPSGDLSQAYPFPPHISPPLRVPDPPHHQVAPAGPAGPPSTGPLAPSPSLKPEDAHHSPCLDMPLREPGSGKEGGRLRAWRHRLREEVSAQSSWKGPCGLSLMELWAPRTSPVGSLCPPGTQSPGCSLGEAHPLWKLGLEKNHG